jgi:hypothetical protein
MVSLGQPWLAMVSLVLTLSASVILGFPWSAIASLG